MSWKRKIIKIKFWIQRAMGYYFLVSGFLTLYLVIGRLRDKGILPWWIERFFPIWCILLFIGIVVFGYIEDRVLKLSEEEGRIAAQRMGLRE